VFIVGKSDGGAFRYFLDGLTDQASVVGGATSIEIYQTAGFNPAGTPANASVLTAVFDGAASKGSVSSNTLTSGSVGVAAPNGGGVTIGNYRSGGFALQGEIAEVRIYEGALSSTQQNSIRAALGSAYSIPIT
jgi:hypothetical protein